MMLSRVPDRGHATHAAASYRSGMAISRTTRTALDLIEALRRPEAIDPRLARQVSASLRLLIEEGGYGPSDRVLRRRSRRLRARRLVR